MRRQQGTLHRLLPVLVGALAWPVPTAGSCYFSDLQWRADGAVLRFQAGAASAGQTLEFQLQTGALVCVEPQAHEAAWDASRRRVLFRDGFGIYEVETERPGVRALAFLPQESRTFLRAFGSDSRGALWLWTLDRDSGEHVFWRRDGANLEALPGSFDGAEALRRWDERTVSVPFQRVGGRFARSTCVQRSSTGERLCLERGDGARAALFRLIVGGPGRIDVVLDRCVPSALVAAADTSRVVAALFEEVDAAGRSDLLTLWVVDFQRATRVVETLLPRPFSTSERQRQSVLWLQQTELLWADPAGQLFRVDTRLPGATALVSRAATVRGSWSRLVVEKTGTRAAAEAWRSRLLAAGFDAGVQDVDGGFEVQAGAFAAADAARTQAEALRRAGFPCRGIVAGPVEAVAAEMSWGRVPSPAGGVAFVRHRRRGDKVLAEIWRESPAGEVELLVPAFDGTTPRSVP